MSNGIAVLHGFDPESGQVTTDAFYEADSPRSPWHRAAAMRESVRNDFPGWIWSIGMNERAHALMTTENMRQIGIGEEDWTDEDSLATVRGER